MSPPGIPRSVLITGANRGIGLGLVKEFAKHGEVQHIIGTTRSLEQAQELQELAKNDPRIHIVQMDVQSDESIRAAYEKVCGIVGAAGLNLLINNAGIFKAGNDFMGTNRASIQEHLDVNATSPVIVTQIFYPLLQMAAKEGKSGDWGAHRAAIVNISSGAGSIADNTMGSKPFGALPYRMSKSALNQLTKILSIDLAAEEIVVTSFCPGWVKTDMGGPNAQLTIDESVEALVKTISTLRKEHSGAYISRNGDTIPY